MRLSFSPEVAADLNARAEELVKLISPLTKNTNDSKSVFHPNYLKPVASIDNGELPSLPLQSTIGINGYEVERYFSYMGELQGLTGSSYESFLEISKTITALPEVADKVSLTYAADAVTHWLMLRLGQRMPESFIAYLQNRLDRDVRKHEIWIPLTGIAPETEIELFKGCVLKLPEPEYRRSRHDWGIIKPRRFEEISEFLSGTHANPAAVFRTTVEGEQIKAVELAQERAVVSLELLRFFSPSNFEPSMYSHCAVYGTEYVNRPSYMLLRNGLIASVGWTDINIRWQHPWKITGESLKRFEEKGLTTLCKIASTEAQKVSDFQTTLLRSIAIYSKVSLAQQLNEKLLYAVVALESLLLKDNSESLQKNISERMALLIGRSLTERRAMIREYKTAYKARSSAVHHGEDVSDPESVKPFLQNTWHTLRRMIELNDKFATTEDLISYIDDMKFR